MKQNITTGNFTVSEEGARDGNREEIDLLPDLLYTEALIDMIVKHAIKPKQKK